MIGRRPELEKSLFIGVPEVGRIFRVVYTLAGGPLDAWECFKHGRITPTPERKCPLCLTNTPWPGGKNKPGTERSVHGKQYDRTAALPVRGA